MHLAPLYERYYTDLVKYVERRSHDHHLAEDIAQDAFIKLDNYPNHIDNPRAFLFTAASNAYRNWVRDNRKSYTNKSVGFEGASDDESSATAVIVIDRAPTAEYLASLSEDCQRLTQAIDQLPTADRTAIQAICLHEMDYSEACSKLGVERAALGMRVGRAIKKLHRTLCASV